MKIDLPKIEKKWQKRWEKARLYDVKDNVKGKRNFYHLVMFPYPSGDLHIGHWYNFAPADMYARFTRMQGFNVLSPFGFDAFGLPAENAAIKRKLHPATWTSQNIKKMREQIKSMGTMYDWSREVITCEPEYYRWTQWMFLQLFKAGLAERKLIYANWCPSCKTVLANEQVIDGLCERCESEVIQKEIDQWVFLITRYAKRLLNDVEKLDWPEKTKRMQKNWIGESEGAMIKFKIQSAKGKATGQKPKVNEIEVFTTRADTLFGATYLVVAPENPIIKNLEYGILNIEEVQDYIKKSLKKNPIERQADQKEKTGVELKGIKAINPGTGKEIPIWMADYVLGAYGTGAIMAVPAHDERDFAFAKKFHLPILKVVQPKPLKTFVRNAEDIAIGAPQDLHIENDCYTGEGELINSGEFNGMDSQKARGKIVKWLERKDIARSYAQYKLRDWIVSRQRYWGCPIPIVYCASCGIVPLPEKDLPVLLPDIKNFEPTGTGKSPLAKSQAFVKTKCPQCKGEAERETDTMDTFVDSSWYFLRYADPSNKKTFASKEKMRQWLPVDIYIGGAEHSVLHLLYARFFTKALFDLGFLSFGEPFLKLRHQGTILGPDGQKMSKSRGNVIDPDELVLRYGADIVRCYLGFMGPYHQGGPWSPGAIHGIARFLDRVHRIILSKRKIKNWKLENEDPITERVVHKTIKKVTEDLEELKFNTAISSLMVLVNAMQKKTLPKRHYEILIKMMAPFAPHLSEELWAKLGHKTSVHKEHWPKADPHFLEEETLTLIVQVNGRLRGKVEGKRGMSEDEAKALALADNRVRRWLEGKTPKKVVFVKNRLINFVA